MFKSNLTVLYVQDIDESTQFYSRIFEVQPVSSSPGFVLFALPFGAQLGLWKREFVEPAVIQPAGANEICLSCADAADVDATHRKWADQGVSFIQDPVQLQFGYTCTAVDPDGHRIRVALLN